MRSLLAGLLLLAPLTITESAFGDDPTVGTDDSGIWLIGVDRGPKQVAVDDNNEASHATEPAEPQLLLGSGACAGAEAAIGQFLESSFCDPEAISGTVALTLGAIRTAFTRLDLPASTLTIQPPDGLTLVNFDTNFFTTDTRPLTRTVTLLGQQVTIEATPATFTWTFGDGEKLSTTDPGAAYPDLRVTHNYRLKDTYRPSLATTYTGRYRLGSGPWRAIPGTVTINGAPQPLRAIEATPKLVGY